MIRWPVVVLMTWPLWFACEKQGHSPDDGTSPESSREQKTTGISQSRRAHESSQSRVETSDEAKLESLVRHIWISIDTDPVAAWQRVVSHDIPEDQRRSMLAQCVTILMMRDRDAAIDWVENATAGAEKEFAVSRVAVAWAATDPQAAAEFLRSKGIEGHDDEVAVVQILQFWAQRSGPEASTWAFSLPTEFLRQSGLEAVSEQWFLHDAAGYGQWLSNRETGPMYDVLVAAAGHTLQGHIPEMRQEFLKQWPAELRQRVLALTELTPR